MANADEIVRQQCIARADAERLERTLKRNLRLAIEEKDAAVANAIEAESKATEAEAKAAEAEAKVAEAKVSVDALAAVVMEMRAEIANLKSQQKNE